MSGIRLFGFSAALLALFAGGQACLRTRRPGAGSVVAEGALATLGGLRSIAAEVVWFRLDRLQAEGRFVELAQLASALTFLEPHTPEIWCFAAWNMAYNVSVMLPTPEDRWRWVHAGLRLLRDDGLRLNPDSPEIMRELATLFEIKIGSGTDASAPVFRREWKRIVEDVRARGAWRELGMDPAEMRRIEAEFGFDDWTDPQLSALYWAKRGGLRDIVRQATILYRRSHM